MKPMDHAYATMRHTLMLLELVSRKRYARQRLIQTTPPDIVSAGVHITLAILAADTYHLGTEAEGRTSRDVSKMLVNELSLRGSSPFIASLQSTMRPAFVLFAIAAAAVARPYEATTDVELLTQLHQTGELDALIEQAFQSMYDESDNAEILKHIKSAAKSVKAAADECGLTDAIKEVGKACLDAGKEALKDAAKDVITSQVKHHAEKLKPGATRRGADVFDELVEQAAQEWVDNQDDATIAALLKGALHINELD
ncbi:hypothetical protein ONZ45_g2421 [Pleurotus djamor]|nr:hypothetical protein ONZ45_g2421 [Pleurotus djamor]